MNLAAPDSIWSARLIDHPGYSPIDAIAIQEGWPAHLSAVSRASWMAGAGAVLVVFALVRRLAGGSLPALAAGLAMAFGGVFWSRAAGGQPATFGALLSLVTLGALLEWRRRPQLGKLLALALSLAGMVASAPYTVATLPLVIVAACTAPGPRSRDRFAIAAVLTAAAAGGGWWALDSLGFGVWGGDWLVPHGLSAVANRLAAIGTLLVSDFGVLGLAFAVIGAVALAAGQRPAFVIIAGWCLFVGLGGLMWAAPDWRSNALPALAPAWVFVGAGMHWLLHQPAPRLLPVTLILLLPAASFTSHYRVGARANTARRFVASYLQTLQGLVPKAAKVIAEGGAIDRAIERADASGGWQRIAQDPGLIESLMARGEPVLGFDRARANLAELGFRFQPVVRAGVLMTPDELLETVPSGWIVAVAAGNRFGLWMPRPSGPGLAAIGARSQTLGSRRHFAVIGVKDSRTGAVEQFGTVADVVVRAGEPATGVAQRWPADLRAVSDDQGGAVMYAGRTVARTSTGIALAVVSPTGTLAAVFSAEFDRGLLIPVRPSGFRAAFVAGREPCAAVTSVRWTDVSDQTAFSSLTGLLEPGQRLVVYLAGDKRLRPRAKRLRESLSPLLDVSEFDTRTADSRAALAAAMLRDQFDDGGAVLSAPFAFRVMVTALPAGVSLLALRLGGSVELAMARLMTARATDQVDVCHAMRGGAGLFANAGVDVEEIDLADDDLLPYGWDRLEHRGPRFRRWTRAHEADVLVPLYRAGPIVLELDVEPAGPAGSRLDLRINAVELPPTLLAKRVQRYRFVAPPHAWRDGMNVIRITTPSLVRPSDVSASRDERQLGVAISRIRLRMVEDASSVGGGS